ncbi:hypothetical protein NM688_g6863 [Phlebia brevispora]|uniref:Uncharacterized protein n=1 Tax=Phlebia brevispora TaxID=194682 RepID=A0ACC1SBM0_9APHY|nr:hypothetical protein NM688_g6863 [Phlebia brevispora]
MVKSKEEIISQFNILTNMSVDELQGWIENPQSKKAGTGVGLESAQKIIGILKKNPSKDPDQYDDEDIEHMRKVVAYDKRHLAQEDHLKETKTKEELENAKSTISLKNWGHDPLKTMDEDSDKPAEPTSNGKEGEDKNAEDSPGPAEPKANGEPEKEKKGSSKRKLNEDEANADNDAEGDTADELKDDEEETDQDVDGGRARKKSRTEADASEA